MFSFEKRTNAINYGDKDRAEINQLILAVQSKHEKQFSNVKELFEFLLNQALSETEPPEIETKTIEIAPDNALILDDSNEIATKCTTLLQEFANSKEIGDSSPAIQILKAIELTNIEPKTIEIKKEIPVQLNENQLLVNLEGNQRKVLDLVVQKRIVHNKRKGIETPATILRDRFFHWDVMEDWTGEFFTGLNRE